MSQRNLFGYVWYSCHDSKGLIEDLHGLKSLIFCGGVEWSLRKIIWKNMLGYYKWDKTDEEYKAARKGLSDSYYRMKLQWMSMTEDQEKYAVAAITFHWGIL